MLDSRITIMIMITMTMKHPVSMMGDAAHDYHHENDYDVEARGS